MGYWGGSNARWIRNARAWCLTQKMGLQCMTNARQYHVAIVGSGPAGMYTADRLLSKSSACQMDIFEQFPVPYGLVRYGVAPDHPEVKLCSHKFDIVFSNERVHFRGNVTVGRNVSVSQLRRHYDAVILAYGAQTDKLLGIPNEHLRNCFSARAFVNWYNGFPCSQTLAVDLQSTDTAVVIGHGNVALDVARMLLSPLDTLKNTDIAQYALEALSKSRIKHVHLVGRRGPLQTSFTTAEVREMFKLPDVQIHFNQDISLLIDPYRDSLERPKKRLMQLMESTHQVDQADKHLYFDFLLQPKEFISDSADNHGTHISSPNTDSIPFKSNASHLSSVKAVEFEETTLIPVKDQSHASARILSTGNRVRIACGLVVKSLGYSVHPLPGVPFDRERGHVPHIGGRILDSQNMLNLESDLGKLYASGWAKRGAEGVLASTMYDAYETADSVISDVGSISSKQGYNGLIRESNLLDVVDYQEYLKIDKEEQARGLLHGKPREKMLNTNEMVSIAKQNPS